MGENHFKMKILKFIWGKIWLLGTILNLIGFYLSTAVWKNSYWGKSEWK